MPLFEGEVLLKERLDYINEEIEKAAAVSGRSNKDVCLIAISKYAAIESMQELYNLGHRDFGEGKLQDLLPKIKVMPQAVKWHFIGRLQSNKVKKVCEQSSFIHSIDRLELAEKLSSASSCPKLFLEVNISHEVSKAGLTIKEWESHFDHILNLNLPIIGLMTMAPKNATHDEARLVFGKLKECQNHWIKLGLNLPYLSMGMSQDYRAAIMEGATHVRIGSALFK
ncbi:MAG: YggS family pyridoxal phosphate-dependent enzyme [Parachlamydiales bacterium]|nr:YggS family pyridoxal phosphate-dependent enzyme [Parachlamydiales bacterium]